MTSRAKLVAAAAAALGLAACGTASTPAAQPATPPAAVGTTQGGSASCSGDGHCNATMHGGATDTTPPQ